MRSHRLEVADVFRKHGTAFLAHFSPVPEQRRVLKAITDCRTAALGGHKRACPRCGYLEISYNSCRNRHCPKCQGSARGRWLEARSADLLDVGYFHIVFTLPHEVSRLALRNRRVVYGLLFRAVSETMTEIAGDPKHLGAKIGFLALLHTWGQRVDHHPHIHCVVPGGGISPDGLRWIASRRKFFLSVRVLSRLFRRKTLRYLRKAAESKGLRLHGTLADRKAWQQFLCRIEQKEWVVYAKPPFGGPKQVLKYLARYTHRVAISNSRLVAMEDDRVSFWWKDYANGGGEKTMTLEAVEFIRRFLMHVLPNGFVRIRYYGWLANRVRRERLTLCRALIGKAAEEEPEIVDSKEPVNDTEVTAIDRLSRCPLCGQGRMVVVQIIDPRARLPSTDLIMSERSNTS